MPVSTPSRVKRPARTRAVLITSIAALAVAALLMALVVRFASREPERVNLGSRVFVVGDAERLDAQIDTGGPLLFQDTLGRGREIYVYHQGRELDAGWIAVEAYAAEAPRRPRCVLVWDPNERRFDDPCGPKTYAPDDTALTTYHVSVDESGAVVVDLRRSGR